MGKLIFRAVGLITLAGAVALGQLGCSGSSGDNGPGTRPSPQVGPASPVSPAGNSQPQGNARVTENVRVASYLAPCTNQSQQLCLVTLDDQGKPAEFIYGSLSGFNYVWGHEYLIGVTLDQNGTTSIGSVQSDISRGTAIGPGLLLNSAFLQNTQGIANGCNFKVGGQLGFTTTDGNTCAQLNGLIQNGQGFRLKLVGDPSAVQVQSLVIGPLLDWQELRLSSTAGAAFNSDSTAACQATPGAIQNTFSIEKDGSYAFLVCDHHVAQSGHLAPNELQQLNSLVASALTSKIYSIACGPGTQTNVMQELYMTSTAGDLLSLRTGDFSSVCTRGEQQQTDALNNLIGSLQARYNGLHIGPAIQNGRQ